MTSSIWCVKCGGPGPSFPETTVDMQWGDTVEYINNTDNNWSPCGAYQEALHTCQSDVIMYIHDDVIITDPDWHGCVMGQFDNPNTVAVGLGGATGLGNKDLYRKPFNIWNMARSGYASNQTDAEVHGERFTGARHVAVLDAFFMSVRTDFLRSVGGWPTKHLTHHCLDLWLACEAARASKDTFMVGAACTHLGGRSSTNKSYVEASWLIGGSIESDHVLPHKWLADTYRDVLPLEPK